MRIAYFLSFLSRFSCIFVVLCFLSLTDFWTDSSIVSVYHRSRRHSSYFGQNIYFSFRVDNRMKRYGDVVHMEVLYIIIFQLTVIIKYIRVGSSEARSVKKVDRLLEVVVSIGRQSSFSDGKYKQTINSMGYVRCL